MIMGAIGPILFGAKLISDINATRQEYKSQQRAYEAQADNARQNAAIQQKKRELQADAYAQKQSQLNDRMKLVRGQAAAAAGAGGFTMDGSVNDILDSSYDKYKKDSLNLLSQQRNDSWSNYVNQVNYINQANAYDKAASNVRKQGHQKIFGTILGAAAQAYGNGWFGGSSSTGQSSWASGSMDVNPFQNSVYDLGIGGSNSLSINKKLNQKNLGYTFNGNGISLGGW